MRVCINKYLFNFTGLWEVCLNGFHDMRHQYEYLFMGCRHILLEEYDIIRDEIQPRKYSVLKKLLIHQGRNMLTT